MIRCVLSLQEVRKKEYYAVVFSLNVYCRPLNSRVYLRTKCLMSPHRFLYPKSSLTQTRRMVQKSDVILLEEILFSGRHCELQHCPVEKSSNYYANKGPQS
ncbi:hypothetical protein ATANTOWER_017423 [Ataeniobius toweri]|uniref:Uncharacterized protein n=1 Tax=Ataeniobius toweri TaxID=208326 RepID=A0ABU7A6W3_9TELE|nr:hypothetical protein [Ataeniobius toweri]